jgi:hypothetical protein
VLVHDDLLATGGTQQRPRVMSACPYRVSTPSGDPASNPGSA